MTDKLIEQIKADQENGTPGPWEKRSFQSGTVQVIMREWNNSKPDPTRDGSMYGYHSAYMTMYNIGWQDESDTDREKSANASRIARVPDMEARILADAEVIEAARELAEDLFFMRDLMKSEITPADDAMAYLQRQTQLWEAQDKADHTLTAFRAAMKKRENG